MTGERLTLRLDRLAYGGAAVGRACGKVCFVRGALPGETVEAVVVRRRARFDEAEVGEVLVASPDRVDSGCPSFGPCGGCDLLHLAPSSHSEVKAGWVREAFRSLPGAAERVEPPDPAAAMFGYRNRMSYSVTVEPDGVVLGFHAKRDPLHILDARFCRLHSEGTRALLMRIHGALAGLSMADAGNVSRVDIRESHGTGQRLVHLAARGPGRAVEAVAAAVRDVCDTAVVSYSRSPRPRARSVERRILFGSGRIEEHFCGWRWDIGPGSFFQVHTAVAERLFTWVRGQADEVGASRIVELYAGTGAMAAVLARPGRSVLGFEVEAEAVTGAWRNLRRNRIEGVQVRRRRVEDLRPERLREGTDLVVADPPRSGLSPRAREVLLGMGAPHLLVISCDPATLVRDLAVLCAGGYRVVRAKPFDMFPQTGRVEVAVRLVRKDAQGVGSTRPRSGASRT